MFYFYKQKNKVKISSCLGELNLTLSRNDHSTKILKKNEHWTTPKDGAHHSLIGNMSEIMLDFQRVKDVIPIKKC